MDTRVYRHTCTGARVVARISRARTRLSGNRTKPVRKSCTYRTGDKSAEWKGLSGDAAPARQRLHAGRIRLETNCPYTADTWHLPRSCSADLTRAFQAHREEKETQGQGGFSRTKTKPIEATLTRNLDLSPSLVKTRSPPSLNNPLHGLQDLWPSVL